MMDNYRLKSFNASVKAEDETGYGGHVDDDENLLRMGKKPVLKVNNNAAIGSVCC